MERATQPTRQPGTRRFRIRPAYIFLLIVMGLFAYKFVEKTRELQTLNHEAAVLRAQNQQTLNDSARLRRNIAYYKTEGYVEQRARQILGYRRPGDTSIISVPSVARAPAQHATYRSAPIPTWREWWNSFFE